MVMCLLEGKMASGLCSVSNCVTQDSCLFSIYGAVLCVWHTINTIGLYKGMFSEEYIKRTLSQIITSLNT